MSLKVKKIKEKSSWEKFIGEFGENSFCQSWDWGEVEKENGHEIFRYGVYEDNEIICLFLLVVTESRKGRYGYIAHGPVFKKKDGLGEKVKILIKILKKIGKEEGLSFIRIGMMIDKDKGSLLKDSKLIKSPTHIYTDNFLILDVEKDENELMRRMRKTTRNLIRRAVKEKVVIVKSKDVKRVKVFYELLTKTAKRHHFSPYSLEFLENEFRQFLKDDNVLMIEGWYDGKLLTSAMIVFYGKSGFYHHGASVLSKIPVSYLLQWEAIKETKKRGLKYYNFWGYAANDDKTHPFYGITKFKKGFSPSELEVVSNYDLVLNYRYWESYLIDCIRRVKRGH